MKRVYENLNIAGNIRSSLTQTGTHHIFLGQPRSWIDKFNKGIVRANKAEGFDGFLFEFRVRICKEVQRYGIEVNVTSENLAISFYKFRSDKWFPMSTPFGVQGTERIKYWVLNHLIDKELR